MKVNWETDEWYPVYSLEPYKGWDGSMIEISDAEWEDYNRVMEEFNAWQDKIRSFDKPKEGV